MTEQGDGLRRAHVAITGAAGGIGAALAREFANRGATIHLLDTNVAALDVARATLRERGANAHGHMCDVTDEAQVLQAFAAINELGDLKVLVNNAAIAIRKAAVDLPLQDWDRVLDVNLTGVFLCARTAARYMSAAGGGAVVNVASIMGLSGGGLYPNISYQATKGAIVNLTRALAVEWASDRIRVNAVAPTWVRTPLTTKLFADPEVVQRMLAVTPLGLLAEPEDVAKAVVFLSSTDARLITGHTLAVDGGFLAQ